MKNSKRKPGANQVSRLLAATLIYSEMIENPTIQKEELNPKTFDTNREF